MKKYKLPSKFYISNVEIWNSDKILKGQDIFIQNGIIQKITPHDSFDTSSYEKLVINSPALIPAGVDAQVHLRAPGQFEKETPETGLKAASRGGYAAILAMPNTVPVIDTPEVLLQAKAVVEKFEKEIGVKVFWSSAITMNQDGVSLTDFEKLAQAGALAFTDDGKGVASDKVMEEALKRLTKIGLPLLQHAETPGHGGVLAPGPLQIKHHLKAYDEIHEVSMVERDLRLLKKYPLARYHVLHVSSKKTIGLVIKAKKEGLKVTAEVSPHHLFFASEELISGGTSFKMNPPIRGRLDRDSLIIGLQKGEIDFVATDHAPHEKENKADFSSAFFGTTGLETSLRVLLNLYSKQLLGPERLVQVFSSGPAKFLGINDQFGSLEEGRPFLAVAVDVTFPSTIISTNDLESLSKNNCFLGHELKGRIEKTFLGNICWDL